MYPMERGEMISLLQRSPVGRLTTCAHNRPYVVPLAYVFSQGNIYLHCAPTGNKMENMRQNPNVCFEVDEFTPSLDRCQSVIVFGTVNFIQNVDQKIKVLQELSRKYQGDERDIDESATAKVEIVEIIIQEMTGRKS